MPVSESSVAQDEELAWLAPPDLGSAQDAFVPSEDGEDGVDEEAQPPAPDSEEHFANLDEMTQSVEGNLRRVEERIAEAEAAPGSESDPELARLRELRDKFTSDIELRRWAAAIDRARAEGRDIPPPPPGLGRPSPDADQFD